MEEFTSYSQVVEAIRAVGMLNSIVCLHSSLKSFGRLEGGADTLIQAFLDLGCTLVVPTFTYAAAVPPPEDRQIPQNGWDDSVSFDLENVEAYDKNSKTVTRDMGAIPARVLELEGRARGLHPLNSFAALGPLADQLIETQSLLNVYGPLKAAYAHPSAYLALIGVDLTKATPIHLAEEMAGRRLFRRWGRDVSGAQQEVAVGSCSEGFNNFAEVVREIETNITVGKSRWRVYPFKAFIDTVTAAIEQDPQITHCADPNCVRCNDAVRGGPLL
jgi:aminoglycoside 3-N-acetyltransferase